MCSVNISQQWLDLIANPIAVIDLHGSIIKINKKFIERINISFDMVIGKNVSECLPRCEAQIHDHAAKILIEKGLTEYFYKVPVIGLPTYSMEACQILINNGVNKPIGIAIIVSADERSSCDASEQKFPLTARERQVIQALVTGLSQKKIAQALGISPFTVNDHLKSAYQKLGVNSRSEAQFIAITKMGM